MTEVIRPSLYGSYHHIQPAAPPLVPATGSTRPLSGDNGPADSATDGYGRFQVVDVVGAVCESGDFLGKVGLSLGIDWQECDAHRGTRTQILSSSSNILMSVLNCYVHLLSYAALRAYIIVAEAPYNVNYYYCYCPMECICQYTIADFQVTAKVFNWGHHHHHHHNPLPPPPPPTQLSCYLLVFRMLPE